MGGGIHDVCDPEIRCAFRPDCRHAGVGHAVTGCPGASLEAYVSAVNSVPMLTVEEEQALARRYRDDQDSTPPGSWCCRTCASWCMSPVATRATACRRPT